MRRERASLRIPRAERGRQHPGGCWYGRCSLRHSLSVRRAANASGGDDPAANRRPTVTPPPYRSNGAGTGGIASAPGAGADTGTWGGSTLIGEVGGAAGAGSGVGGGSTLIGNGGGAGGD